MVYVTLERLCMVFDKIVDFWFFVKFHMSGPEIIFSFLTLTEHVSYPSKKLLNKQKTSSTWWVFLWKDYRCFLIELSIFWFFVKFHRFGPAIIFSFWTLWENVNYASKKLLNKQKTSSTWWVFFWKDYRCFLIELSIFWFFVKFHKFGPAIIFSFWTLREYVSYASKKLLNKQKTCSTWWVFLWKDYRSFLIEFSIF